MLKCIAIDDEPLALRLRINFEISTSRTLPDRPREMQQRPGSFAAADACNRKVDPCS